ncbi:MAG: hypothetical protein B6D79_00995, partial [gamma proteobacterium symbiont of Ctena orbiculata]
MNNIAEPVDSRGRVEKNGFSEPRELIRSFLYIFIPASFLLAVIFYIFSTQTHKYELQTTLLREELALSSTSELTSLIFEQKLSDLMILAEGEVLQLLNVHNPDTSEADYMEVIKRKTATLFEAGARLGGIITGVDEDQQQALADYG